MLHEGKATPIEFQKFADSRSIVSNLPLGVLARLNIARAYAMQGGAVKARANYEDFLAIWKDADPDIPVLKQAKVEYTKLL